LITTLKADAIKTIIHSFLARHDSASSSSKNHSDVTSFHCCLSVNATQALVISQVVLSIALPLPMIALLVFTRRADIMGQFANGRGTHIAAMVATAVVLLLNIFLILQTSGVAIPGLSSAG
jgi:Natural resistance-associated macrophage protein